MNLPRSVILHDGGRFVQKDGARFAGSRLLIIVDQRVEVATGVLVGGRVAVGVTRLAGTTSSWPT